MSHENKPSLSGRRKVLKMIGAGGASLLAGNTLIQSANGASKSTTQAKVCLVSPRQMEGPYFVDERLKRSDIRIDPTDGAIKEGTPLRLIINVSAVNNGHCKSLSNAMVDVWHCDANGVYSDVEDFSFDTRGKKFLRGYQLSDENGSVEFLTIYPGWYPGRAVHIHFKVRTANKIGKIEDFTSQMYFDDSITDQVYRSAPYNKRGSRTPRNEGDIIYNRGSGHLLQLRPKQNQQGEYVAILNVGVESIEKMIIAK